MKQEQDQKFLIFYDTNALTNGKPWQMPKDLAQLTSMKGYLDTPIELYTSAGSIVELKNKAVVAFNKALGKHREVNELWKEDIDRTFKPPTMITREKFLADGETRFREGLKILQIDVVDMPEQLGPFGDLFAEATARAYPFNDSGDNFRDAALFKCFQDVCRKTKHSVSVFVTEDKGLLRKSEHDGHKILTLQDTIKLVQSHLQKKIAVNLLKFRESLEARIIEELKGPLTEFINSETEFSSTLFPSLFAGTLMAFELFSPTDIGDVRGDIGQMVNNEAVVDSWVRVKGTLRAKFRTTRHDDRLYRNPGGGLLETRGVKAKVGQEIPEQQSQEEDMENEYEEIHPVRTTIVDLLVTLKAEQKDNTCTGLQYVSSQIASKSGGLFGALNSEVKWQKLPSPAT